MNLIRETVHEQMEDKTVSKELVDRRILKLDQYRVENSLNLYEVLEDVIEQLDNETWKSVIKGIRYKYGHIK